MGSSAQKSSSVHWCRCWVRFNKVPEKVPKLPEKVWEASVQSQVRFNRVLEKVWEKVREKVPEVGESSVQSQVSFNKVPKKVPEKVPEKVPGGFGAEPGQVQQGSGESSGGGLGGFGAEPGQVQQRSGEGPGKVWEALVQNQVRFNRGSGEASGEGLGGFGAEPGQVQQGSGEKVPEKVLGGFGQGQVGFNRVPGKSGRLCKVRFNRVLEKVPEKV